VPTIGSKPLVPRKKILHGSILIDDEPRTAAFEFSFDWLEADG
jgi:hypothetical protein